jgi:hypothetical protein
MRSSEESGARPMKRKQKCGATLVATKKGEKGTECSRHVGSNEGGKKGISSWVDSNKAWRKFI